MAYNSCLAEMFLEKHDIISGKILRKGLTSLVSCSNDYHIMSHHIINYFCLLELVASLSIDEKRSPLVYGRAFFYGEA